MPAYDGERFSPAAPVATVSVRNIDSEATIDGVRMVFDTGADITALPRAVVDALALPDGDRAYEVMAYDNTVKACRSVRAEVVFMRGHFKGHFVVLDQDIGVLGRNILNHLVVTLDGPRLEWEAR
jgi:predicted aspartyl protease